MSEPSLGLVMILKNEAANLERSLKPIARQFDEIVVVDTGSTDTTPRLCADLGARVFNVPWRDDFALARNHCIAQASADWLLWLDGDNSIDIEEVSALRMLLPKKNPAIIWGQELVTNTGGRLWQKRCFPRHPEVKFQGRVHEQLVHPPHWETIVSPLVIKHWGYENPEAVALKGRYYLMLLNKTLAAEPDDFYSHFQASRCHVNLRQFGPAADHLWLVVHSKMALRQNPGLWTQAHADLSRLLEQQGRHTDATLLLDGLLQQTPASGLGHFHRGRLAHIMSQWQKACYHLELSLKLGLGNPIIDLDPVKTTIQAWYYLGQSRQNLGDLPGARKAFEHALELSPTNPACRAQLARVMLEMGDVSAAESQAAAMLAQRPGDKTALRLLRSCQETS